MKRLIVILFLLISSTSFAQPGSYGLWPGYYGSGSIDDRWGIWLEVQPRMYDFQGDLEQLLTRAAVTYKLNPDVQVAQGYGYIRSEPYVGTGDQRRTTEEHRVYQQLILRQRWSRFYLQHRYRLEER